MSGPIAVQPGDRLYLDADLLVRFFYTGQNLTWSRKARDLIRKIEMRRYDGVVSRLAIIELITTLRRLYTEHSTPRRTMTVIEAMIRRSVAALYKINNLRIIDRVPDPLDTILKEALAMTIIYPGTQEPAGRTSSGWRHKGLYAPDLLHLTIAKGLHCDKLATFDTGFRQTSAEIPALIMQDPNVTW